MLVKICLPQPPQVNTDSPILKHVGEYKHRLHSLWYTLTRYNLCLQAHAIAESINAEHNSG